MRLAVAAVLCMTGLCMTSLPCLACEVDGDSIALGLAAAMPECRHSAQGGISSTEVVGRVRGGNGLVIASAGSNDFNRLDVIWPSLDRIRARAHGRLLLVLPANQARGTVAGWAAAHGVRTVSFTAGEDGVHPADYRELARRVRARR